MSTIAAPRRTYEQAKAEYAASVAVPATPVIDPTAYDRVIVAFSGGKDSIACVLALIEAGVDRSTIELWHHDIDGREGSHLMDWACTPGYCRSFARDLGLPIYFSWKVGGFEGEMTRDGVPTAPTRWENPDGTVGQAGGVGKPGTRLKFPQVTASLTTRWCSAYLKVDVMAIAIRNQPRFRDARTLVVTGERGEESACRAGYATEEVYRADNRDGASGRHIDQWRPIHKWSEERVWAIMQRHGIDPHPAYKLGWGRVSCAGCIFANANQVASHRAVNPAQFAANAAYEVKFGITIKRTKSLTQLADEGTPYAATADAALVAQANDRDFDQPVAIDPAAWTLPAGAFGDKTGPL